MASVFAKNKIMTLRAYQGDVKTLLAFDIPNQKNSDNLAGFTVLVEPKGRPPYYLFNTLRYEVPARHAQIDTEPAVSSINAPIHKFRWLHIPGSVHQGTEPFLGPYTYTVTPRFFDGHQSMLPIDKSLSLSVTIDVIPFVLGNLALGFTRGFTQSQAFDRHFGLKAKIIPAGKDLLFETSEVAGTNDHGETFTFADEYAWSGFTARRRIFEILDEVKSNANLSIDVFAYDLNEPDFCKALLEIGRDRRVRIILDNASLHHDTENSKPEDEFETLFIKAAGKGAIKRGKFGRFAHNKVIIVSDKSGPVRVSSGSTNFSVTGLYVNSNHILVIRDRDVAKKYSEVFNTAFEGDVTTKSISASPLAAGLFEFGNAKLPKMEIAFSPHPKEVAEQILRGVADRVIQEGKIKGGSVLFAVMELANGTGPVLDALKDVHENETIFSYGVTDSEDGISLYSPRRRTGVLVTGKPRSSQLPPPFDQVRTIGGFAHQIHHKFIICGFNRKDAFVACGSSNLALGGESANGDNLLIIHDSDVATAFALEALSLVDHFEFLDRMSLGKPLSAKKPKFASKEQVAVSAEVFLSVTDKWVEKFYDSDDLHCIDRELFR